MKKALFSILVFILGNAYAESNIKEKLKKIYNSKDVTYRCLFPSGKVYPNNFRLDLTNKKADVLNSENEKITEIKFEKGLTPKIARFFENKNKTYLGVFIEFDLKKDIASYTEVENITVGELQQNAKKNPFKLIPENHYLTIDLKCDRYKASIYPAYQFTEFEKNYLIKTRSFAFDPYSNQFVNDYPNAMITLGWLYYTGEDGFVKNPSKAIEWNERASNLGYAIASSNLGLFYYAGRNDIEQNFKKAHKFYYLSALQWDNKEPKDSDFYKPADLLSEMNEFYPNPSLKFKKLRNAYIDTIKDKNEDNLNYLKNIFNN